MHSLLHTATQSQQASAILCTLTSVFAIPQVQGHLNELCDSGVTPVSASTVSAQVTNTYTV